MTAGLASEERLKLFVGTYSAGKERGLARLTWDGARFALGARVSDIENASFAAKNDSGDLHYILNERDPGMLGVWGCGEDGEFEQVCNVRSGGALPCHIALHPSGGALAIAHYGGGEVALHRIETDGRVAGAPVIATNTGSGPNRDRQSGPHAHCVGFAGAYLYSCDLGTDEVLCRTFDGDELQLGPRSLAFKLPAGQGPRQLAFHPAQPIVYVLSELGSEIFVLAHDADGCLRQLQRLSNLPAGYAGQSLGGHLAINDEGDRLYASNRGHDSLASYAIDANGRLRLMQITSSGAASPRHFRVSDASGRIILANEEGHAVTVLEIDSDRAAGAVLQVLAMARPAFIGIF